MKCWKLSTSDPQETVYIKKSHGNLQLWSQGYTHTQRGHECHSNFGLKKQQQQNKQTLKQELEYTSLNLSGIFYNPFSIIHRGSATLLGRIVKSAFQFIDFLVWTWLLSVVYKFSIDLRSLERPFQKLLPALAIPKQVFVCVWDHCPAERCNSIHVLTI